jgi:prolyl oligopeptidase
VEREDQISTLFLAAGSISAALLAGAAVPARESPVTETLFGTSIKDPYRGFEALDPETVRWIRNEGRVARHALNALPGRAARLHRLAALERRLSGADSYQDAGGRAFYRRRSPRSDTFDLVVRDRAGVHTLIDLAKLRSKRGGRPLAINFFLASPDGRKVAAGISAGGSEDAAIMVYDAVTGRPVAGPVDRGSLGLLSWRADSKVLFLNRLRSIGAGAPDTDKYKDSRIEAWDLKSPPRTLQLAAGAPPPRLRRSGLPQLLVAPGAPFVAMAAEDGAETDYAYWLAPAADLSRAAMNWRPFVSHDDGVTDLQMHARMIFLLSHRDAPTFQVLAVDAGQPLQMARDIVPAAGDEVIEMIRPASDALYVVARKGIYARLLRWPYKGGKLEQIAMPEQGQVTEAFARPDRPGVTIQLDSWTEPPRSFSYDPQARRLKALKLVDEPDLRTAGLRVEDVEAEARDGVAVPLTLMRGTGPSVPRITLLRAYGSYGISDLPHFSVGYLDLVQEGGVFADCHVRGGGELGEKWRLGGKDARKPNSWGDLIACAEDLIRRHVTTPDKLFIYGGSAGGIVVGRAMTDRPDLFAGVIAAVPAVNTTRMEFSPDGPLEVQEFGSISTKAGFRNLLEMDTYQHVRDGVRYPPILITMGLNDPRIPAWEPAKLAARLIASDARNHVLLRVDRDNGHGIGSTRAQSDSLWADILSFVLRRAPDARPRQSRRKPAVRRSLRRRS